FRSLQCRPFDHPLRYDPLLQQVIVQMRLTVSVAQGQAILVQWRRFQQEQGTPQRGQPGARLLSNGRRIFQLLCKLDRKSTRLNSSHVKISYAVFCLKKKKTTKK